jgi:hypothetical protein
LAWSRYARLIPLVMRASATDRRVEARRPKRGLPRRAPLLLGLALHGLRIRVLHLKSIGRVTGTVGRALTLGHDAFQPELAGMAEHHLAVLML